MQLICEVEHCQMLDCNCHICSPPYLQRRGGQISAQLQENKTDDQTSRLDHVHEKRNKEQEEIVPHKNTPTLICYSGAHSYTLTLTPGSHTHATRKLDYPSRIFPEIELIPRRRTNTELRAYSFLIARLPPNILSPKTENPSS